MPHKYCTTRVAITQKREIFYEEGRRRSEEVKFEGVINKRNRQKGLADFEKMTR